MLVVLVVVVEEEVEVEVVIIVISSNSIPHRVSSIDPKSGIWNGFTDAMNVLFLILL